MLLVNNRWLIVLLLIVHHNDLFSAAWQHTSWRTSPYAAWVSASHSHTNVASVGQQESLFGCNKGSVLISHAIPAVSHCVFHHANIHESLSLYHFPLTHLHLGHTETGHSHFGQDDSLFISHHAIVDHVHSNHFINVSVVVHVNISARQYFANYTNYKNQLYLLIQQIDLYCLKMSEIEIMKIRMKKEKE